MSRERTYGVEAVILKRSDLGEADRLLTLYSASHGKLRVVAKGIRKTKSRKSGHLELFMRSNILLARGRNLDIVTQAEIIEAFLPIRADLERTAHAYYIAELIDQFAEESLENRLVFDLLLTALRRLGDSGDLWLTARFYELRLLGAFGYQPQLHYCVQGDEAIEPVDNYFDAARGGVLCPRHGAGESGARPLSLNALKTLRYLQTRDYDECARLALSAPTRAEVETVLLRTITHLLERRLKSAEFVRALRRPELVEGRRE
ncbi:MAG: DNA repair protein RecO [Chloroflexi bacterium]|nr:DNA repair protein RecO [Chloroflexota bacterium]MBI3731890.1 DNA repair protein RecO [Chloroflexota bacterium]